MLLIIAANLLSMAGSLPLNVFRGRDDELVASEGSALPNLHADIAQSIGKSHGLTERETEVLALLVSGRSRPRIAEILCVSENTVNSHIQHMHRKLEVHSFQELLDFVYHQDSQ